MAIRFVEALAPALAGGGLNLQRVPWTCQVCGTHYAGVQILVPGLGSRRIPPPEVGDCAECREAEHKAEMVRLRREEEQRIADWFLRNSEIGPEYRACSFENFQITVGAKLAVTKALEFVGSFPDADGQWLLLFGTTGNGKTHLGMAIRNEIERRYGTAGLAITQPYLLKEIRASWGWRPGEDADGRSESWILDKLQGSPFVLIDDLMRWPQWADDRMFVLLDGRYRNNRKMMFTSNHTPEQLEAILGPRLWSRFAGRTQMVRLQGPDYRIERERGQPARG